MVASMFKKPIGVLVSSKPGQLQPLSFFTASAASTAVQYPQRARE